MEPIFGNDSDDARKNAQIYIKQTAPISYWKMAAAIAIGGYLAAIGYTVTMGIAARVQAEMAIREIRQSLQQQEQQNAQRRRAQAEQQRQQAEAQAERQRAAQEEKARRDAAWNQFYQPSPSCKNDSSQTVCVNEHIRAKTAFEKLYRAGQL